MKKYLPFICLLALLFITACTSSVAQKAIDESKLSMANGDYQAALNYLQLAQKEGSDNAEIKEMSTILENYIKAKDEFDKINMDGASAALDAIPDIYKNYSIATDIDKLRMDISDKKTVMGDVDSQIAAVKKWIANGDYDSAEANITELYSKDITNYQRKQIDELKSTLDSAKSKIAEAKNSKPAVVYVPQTSSSSSNNYSSIISNRSDSEIENYISSYVRPLYNEVNNNLNSYSKSTSGGISYWRDDKGYIKKTFSSGVNGYNLSREYYYDTDSGRITFAFLYSGSTEYRLYFRTNQLVRYIGPNGMVVNNPTANDALRMASYVLSEAY